MLPHCAHRLLSESTLILCTWRNRGFGDRQWFRPASERQRYQLQAKQHSPRLIKRPLSRLPVSPIIIERLRLLSVPKFDRCSPTLGFAQAQWRKHRYTFLFVDDLIYWVDEPVINRTDKRSLMNGGYPPANVLAQIRKRFGATKADRARK